MRPKARRLAQHGGPPGWVEESDPAWMNFYVIDDPCRLNFLNHQRLCRKYIFIIYKPSTKYSSHDKIPLKLFTQNYFETYILLDKKMSESRFMPETMTNRAEDWDLELEQCKIRTDINCKKKLIQNTLL